MLKKNDAKVGQVTPWEKHLENTYIYLHSICLALYNIILHDSA